MTAGLGWFEVVGRLRGRPRYVALALFLYSYADEMGRLPQPPKTLMRNIFGDREWGKISNAVDQMRNLGLLSNTNPRGGAAGVWHVHLPEGVEPSILSNPALVEAARDFVAQFGPEMTPPFIQILSALSAP